ncbi:hypothetical protein CPC08DRAFT_823066 [Agrocybe pediades]|nr:hypothetical protein CPC08DRAFT_823066 [Agrocybe pediades]
MYNLGVVQSSGHFLPSKLRKSSLVDVRRCGRVLVMLPPSESSSSSCSSIKTLDSVCAHHSYPKPATKPTVEMRICTTLAAATLLTVSGALGLTLQPLVNATIGGQADVYWTQGPHDPSNWTLFLMDPTDFFGLKGILGERIDNSLGHITVSLDNLWNVEPGVEYNLQAANPDNVDFRYASSPVFTLKAPN